MFLRPFALLLPEATHLVRVDTSPFDFKFLKADLQTSAEVRGAERMSGHGLPMDGLEVGYVYSDPIKLLFKESGERKWGS